MSLVSVIIPNYNYARFLRLRIDSVLNQTHRNLEVIILDDCSTDQSKEVIEAYRKEKRISHIIYNEQNSGTTFKQWQKGFELAKGEYIWIAEADDYADPRLLETLISKMADDKEIKVGFVNSNWVTPDGTHLRKGYTIRKPYKVCDGKRFVRKRMLKGNYIYNASMAIFRRDALAHVDQRYMSFRSCGDKLFWKSLAEQGKVLYVCQTLNYFRIHDDKVTSNSTASGLLFEEENRLFHINLDDRTISDNSTRLNVVRFFLKKIKNNKYQFRSHEIYQHCRKLWKEECNYKNKQLPITFRCRCFLYNLFHL